MLILCDFLFYISTFESKPMWTMRLFIEYCWVKRNVAQYLNVAHKIFSGYVCCAAATLARITTTVAKERVSARLPLCDTSRLFDNNKKAARRHQSEKRKINWPCFHCIWQYMCRFCCCFSYVLFHSYGLNRTMFITFHLLLVFVTIKFIISKYRIFFLQHTAVSMVGVSALNVSFIGIQHDSFFFCCRTTTVDEDRVIFTVHFLDNSQLHKL